MSLAWLQDRSIADDRLRYADAQDDLLSFTHLLMPQYEAAAHHALIADRLMDIEAGRIDRLLIVMPPRHGKTELASIRFPAWYLGRRPTRRVIACSYSAGLAYRLSRRARNNFTEPAWPFWDVRLADDLANVQSWDLAGGGGYISAGVGGPITGQGADLLIVDDPVKSAADADSPTQRDAVWQWYQDTAYPRLQEAGAVVVIGTRWHPDDLIGRLLAAQGQGGDRWEVLYLPALAGEEDALGRMPGEALWPDRYPVERLERTRANMSSRAWSAQYQGSPVPQSGALWKLDTIDRQRVAAVPDGVDLIRIVVAVDPPASSGERAAECGIVVAAVGSDRTGYVLEDASRKGTPAEWSMAAIAAFDRWQADAVVIEVNQGGDMATSTLRTVRETVPITEVRASRGKAIRAEPVSALYEQGRVRHVGRHVALEDQLATWTPGMDSPDRLDALVWAMTDLIVNQPAPAPIVAPPTLGHRSMWGRNAE